MQFFFACKASRKTGLASLTGDERADDKPSTRRSVAVLKQALLRRSCILLGSYLGHALLRYALVSRHGRPSTWKLDGRHRRRRRPAEPRRVRGPAAQGRSSEGRAWGMADILTDVPRRVWPARPGISPRRPARDQARPRRRLTPPAQAFAGHAEDHWINVVTSRAGGAFAEVRRPPAPREPARRAARGRCESARARARARKFASRATPSTAPPARSSGRRASKATSWACGPGAAMIDCGSDFVIRAGPRGDLLRVVSASASGPVRNSGGL